MADETNAGFLCYKKGGSALAYSKIASNNGALIYKSGGWYIEIELVPKTASDSWTGIWGIYISSKNDSTYAISGDDWRCYDNKSTFNIMNDAKKLFTRVDKLKWRTGIIIDANAGDTIDFLVPSVVTDLGNKIVVASFSDHYDFYAMYSSGYNYVNGYNHDLYVTSYSAGGVEIQRERAVFTRTNPPYSYAWAISPNGASVTIDIMKLTITKDGDDKGKFTLSYANP